jgi:transposase
VPREQIALWSQRLDDAIPADHPVRHVDLILHSTAFADTFKEWEAGYVLTEGKPPYHPRYLAGLYLYGMLTGVRSSRQLERACSNRIDVIWLMSGQTPDHSTIAAFVRTHAKPLRRLFKDTLQVGMEAGLVKLDHVTVDGTKIEADAGKGSVHKEESIRSYLGKLDDNVQKLEAEWEANEKREATLLGDDVPWTPKNGQSMERRLSAMKAEQERLKKALANIAHRRQENLDAGATAPKAIASVSDPDSRVMPDKEGKSKPNFNAQLAVDESCGMVVATQVNDKPNDVGQFSPMLEEVRTQCGQLPNEASADSGYNTGPELAAVEALGVVSYLPDAGDRSDGAKPNPEEKATKAMEAARSGQTLTEEEQAALPVGRDEKLDRWLFTYEEKSNTYRCPTGQELVFLRTSENRTKGGVVVRRQYGGCAACATCPLASRCCSDPKKGRTINRDQYEEHRERLRARMKSESGRQRYKRRRETVEPRIGWAKRGLGVRRFMRRGLEAVTTEWSLVCTAMNLSILLRNWDAVQRVIGLG